MTEQFSWIDIYQELATTLINWQNKQTELIAFLEELRSKGYIISSLQDKNKDGERFLSKEIDPFTFFGVFNRGIRSDQRIAILAQIKQFFKLSNPIPSDFTGIPVLNNMASWFFPYQANRELEYILRLWNIFKMAVQDYPLKDELFQKTLDKAFATRGLNVNLTMGLFWIRPNTFLSLDSVNREFLHIEIPKGGLTAAFYFNILKEYSSKGRSFPEISKFAWDAAKKGDVVGTIPREKELIGKGDRNYWLVGAYWDNRDPQDQTPRFIEEGIWKNGYKDRYIDEVKSMKVNDRIAIKAATTQRKNLPFDGRDQTISRMIIKAVGTIVANRGDGRTVEVEWDPAFKEKSWYFYTARTTLWRLRTDDDYKFKEFSKRLIDFVWYSKEQDYGWFSKHWWDTEGQKEIDEADEQIEHALSSESAAEPYGPDDILASGVFLEEHEVGRILNHLRVKKAMILQGPPGVGKNFIAKKIAYALMEEVDNHRIEMVQFHQSYSYDDFVRGYRPLQENTGGFGIQNGIFYNFCQNAIKDPERKYVFIIDEINRGNLSQIFGELLMLIESDKRGPEFALPLVYTIPGEPRFQIPHNLYIIGLMNVADRSLAMVDYALRRRFAFITLKPQYESDIFRDWLLKRSMNENLVNLIVSRMSGLNQTIKDDPLLGEHFQIGHSFFCPKGDNFAELDHDWYKGIVETEIAPLLKEYWFDNAQKADEAIKSLLS